MRASMTIACSSVAAAGLALFGAAVGEDPPPEADEPSRIIELSDGEKELKEQFNKHLGKVRLVVIVSPT